MVYFAQFRAGKSSWVFVVAVGFFSSADLETGDYSWNKWIVFIPETYVYALKLSMFSLQTSPPPLKLCWTNRGGEGNGKLIYGGWPV